MNNNKEFLTIKDVAMLFGVHTNTVYHWAKYKILPCKRVGIGRGRWFFLKEEVYESFKNKKEITRRK